MKILVTGHKGFIGSNMVRRLKELKHTVGTYGLGDKLPDVSNYDWVIHLGANSSTTERNVELIMQQNLDSSIWFYEQCKEYDVNFQYSSSASIYGFNKEFKEDSPVDPRTPYAWTKYLFERYVKQNPGNIIFQGFRYFNVYGPNEEDKGSQASPYTQFAKQAKENKEIRVFESSENYKRDFIFVGDIVDYHIKFLEVKECGVWNLGNGTTKSFLEVAKAVNEQYNVPIVEIPMPEKLKSSYQEYTCADMTKTINTLKKHSSHS